MHLIIDYNEIKKMPDEIKSLLEKQKEIDTTIILFSNNDGFMMTTEIFNMLREIKGEMLLKTYESDVELSMLIGYALNDSLTLCLENNQAKTMKKVTDKLFSDRNIQYYESKPKKTRKRTDSVQPATLRKKKESDNNSSNKIKDEEKPQEKTVEKPKTEKTPVSEKKENKTPQKTIKTAPIIQEENSEEEKATGEFVRALLKVKSDIDLKDYADEIYASIKNGGMSDTYNITLPFQLQIRCGATHSKEIYHAIEDHIGELRKYVK